MITTSQFSSIVAAGTVVDRFQDAIRQFPATDAARRRSCSRGSPAKAGECLSPVQHRPMPVSAAWSLLSPEPVPRIDVARWTQQARTFFAADIAFVQQFTDPLGELPECAAFEIDVSPASVTPERSRVRLITVPATGAPDVIAAANDGVTAIGGAGFEVLVA